MELQEEERALFQRVFEAPSDAYIQFLSPTQFPRFIYYLYQRDGLYKPIYVDGPADGGVDIELRSRNGSNPELEGVVQCKRYLKHKVKPAEIVVFLDAARKSGANRRYFFTTKNYTNAARREARNNGVILFDPAGIREWIHDIRRRETPVPIESLPHRDQVPVPVICVSNNKGGVGKTTIVGNLAAALATDERGVLVIDMDPQGHLTRWLTGQHEHFAADLSVHAVLTKGFPIHALVRKTLEPGVWLLPSSRELEDLPGSHDAFSLEERLTHALAALPLTDPPIHFVLIDTPPSLGFLTRSATIASNSLLVPLQLDNLSYEGLTDFLTFVDHIEAQHDRSQPIHVLGGVATVVDQRLNLSQKFEKEIPQATTAHPRLQKAALTSERFWCGVLRRRVDFPRAIDERKSVVALTVVGQVR